MVNNFEEKRSRSKKFYQQQIQRFCIQRAPSLTQDKRETRVNIIKADNLGVMTSPMAVSSHANDAVFPTEGTARDQARVLTALQLFVGLSI